MQFLFGANAVSESSRTLGADVVKLFEEAAEEETDQLAANKKPLATALKAVGISAKVNDCCEIVLDDGGEYKEYMAKLTDPDNMHKLAELGWVVAAGGDAGMSNEAPDYKIGFVELTTVETGDSDKAPELEKVLKDAQKFSATAVDRDDDSESPIENDVKGSDDKQKGVGKPADGKKPEGKPKGSTAESRSTYSVCKECGEKYPSGTRVNARDGKMVPCECGSTEYRHGVRENADLQAHRNRHKGSTAKQVADSLLDEMTACAAIPPVDGPPIGMVGRPADRFRPKKKKLDAPRKPNR